MFGRCDGHTYPQTLSTTVENLRGSAAVSLAERGGGRREEAGADSSTEVFPTPPHAWCLDTLSVVKAFVLRRWRLVYWRPCRPRAGVLVERPVRCPSARSSPTPAVARRRTASATA